MVRNCERVSDPRKWSQFNLTVAVAAMNSGVSKISRAVGWYQTVFTDKQETELVPHIIEMEKLQHFRLDDNGRLYKMV